MPESISSPAILRQDSGNCLCPDIVQKHPLGIAEIDFFQHIIRQEQSIDLPAPLPWNLPHTVAEILVIGFEEAVVNPVHVWVGAAVRTEQNPVGIAQKEAAGSIGLPPQFADASTDVHV